MPDAPKRDVNGMALAMRGSRTMRHVTPRQRGSTSSPSADEGQRELPQSHRGDLFVTPRCIVDNVRMQKLLPIASSESSHYQPADLKVAASVAAKGSAYRRRASTGTRYIKCRTKNSRCARPASSKSTLG